jgi:hypothetical protein
VVPAGISVASLTEIEIETLTPLLVASNRRRVVPVEAARGVETVVIALVVVPETMVVIAPVQAPVASVQVPAQLCMVIVSGEIDVKLCWTPNELIAVV